MGKQFLYGRGFKLQVCISIACDMAFFLMGYDQGVYSSVVSDPDFLDKVSHPDNAQLGIIVASYNLGCLAGSILAFFFAEKLGRRYCIWVAMGWIIVGAILQCTAFTRTHLIIGRIICGIGTGIDTSTVPMYQAELSPPKARGRLVCAELMFVNLGIAFSYWYDYGMTFVNNPLSWRLPIASQVIFALVCVVMIFGVPESPRYLCKIGRPDDALEALSAVKDLPLDHYDVTTEHEDILRALALEQEHGEYQWKNLFKKDHVQTGRRVWLAYGVYFINQMCGINLVVYYIPTVLRVNVGLPARLAQLLGGVINIVFALSALFPTFFADRYGRRKPLMIGSAGCGFSMMMVAILLSFGQREDIGPQMSKASIAFFFTFMVSFGMSITALPWVYGPEVLPLHARTKGNAFGISAIWLWNFFVVMITPVVINAITWKSYLIFALLNYSFIPMLYFYYPELANLTLEQVDDVFTAGIDPVKAAAQMQDKLKRGRIAAGNTADMAESDPEERRVSMDKAVDFKVE